jgi:FkbM family methyltransferase
MPFERIPIYWRRRLKILLHNMRTRSPELAIRVQRSGELFRLSVGGEQIYIVSISRWSKYRNGIPFQLEKLARRYGAHRLRDRLSGQTVIDIGANVGELGLYCQRAGASVYAIEPDPINYAALERNTSGTGIEPFQFALWDKEESLTFYSSVAGADSSLIEPDADSRPLQVNAVPLDSLTRSEGIGRVFFLKADAEGAEPEVLRGGLKTLRRTCYVSIDCGPERKGERTFEACRLILDDLGFKTCALDKEENVLFGANADWESENPSTNRR